MTFELLLSVIALAYACLLIALSLRILMKRRPIGVTLSWLLFIYILPGMGILMYLLFGERYLGSLRARRATEQFKHYSKWLKSLQVPSVMPESSPKVMQLVHQAIGAPSLSVQSWKVLHHPDTLFNTLLNDINQAKKVIFAEFYIIQVKGDVHKVVDALIAAAKRGVHVHLLFDSVGSSQFFRSKQCKEMRNHGIQIVDALHANILRMTLRRQDLRMHRKLISIDSKVSYTGSMNLVDPKHFKTEAGVGAWIDIMIRLEGEISHFIQSTLVFDWELETGIRLEKHLCWPTQSTIEKEQIQLLPSGPAIDDELLLQVLLTAIHSASKRVVITTPYFVPDESLFQALKTAAKRNISVTILLPRYNDSRLAQYAGRSFFEELLLAGVNIMHFHGGLLHTKAVVIDDALTLVGSVNLDMRSIWLNFESTLIVDDLAFNKEIMTVIDGYIEQSQSLSLATWQSRPFYKKLLESLAQLTSPLL
jgi:cardiolipin synthase